MLDVSLDQFKERFAQVRQDCFDRALAYPVQKRERLWLERLKGESRERGPIPEGWTRSTEFPEELPSRKQEKSVLYWLHRALTPAVLTFEVPAGTHATVVLPAMSMAWEYYHVNIGEGAEVTLVDEQSLPSAEGQTPFRGVFVEIGARARVVWKGFQNHDDSLTTFDHKRFVVGEGARLHYAHHVVGGLNSWDEGLFELMGDHAEVFSQTVFFGCKNQQQEMRVNHMHAGQQTKSHMVSKGAVNDQSHASFLGMIQMERGCNGADGYLEEHNLLLSSGSKIDAVPGLEIGHHDVKAGHAAYMERVDEEKLFYAAARGIPADEAVELIVEGFFLDAIAKIEDEVLQQRIFDSILKGLHPQGALLV